MATPIILGITGGIGSGKSEFVAAMQRRGALAFSADEAVHRLYGSVAVKEAVVARWGERVLDADGNVDRSRIAHIVFADRPELEWLEALLHPLVEGEWKRFVAAAAARDDVRAIVAEVPLLFEANLEHRYDRIVLLTAPLDLRIERVGERAQGGELARERAARQMPDVDKARRADFVFVNDRDLAALDAFAGEVLDRVHVPAGA